MCVAKRVRADEGDPTITYSAFIPLIVEVESIGAAFQNMCLAAHAQGLGSLWVGDVFYAAKEISEFAHIEGELMGAVSLGYTSVNPRPLPRKSWQEVTKFAE